MYVLGVKINLLFVSKTMIVELLVRFVCKLGPNSTFFSYLASFNASLI